MGNYFNKTALKNYQSQQSSSIYTPSHHIGITSETCWCFPVHAFLLLTVPRRCRFCWSFFLKFIFHIFMLSSPGDIYVKNLTFTLYCGGVCVWGGGGAQSMRSLSSILPFLKYSEPFAKIRDDAFKFVSLRNKSYLIAPYRYGRTEKYCLCEQTHCSELHLEFVTIRDK